MKRIFFCISKRDYDSNGLSLDEFKYEVGNEMIATYDGGTVTVDGYQKYGGIFVFTDPKPEEISPYVSLAQLFGVRMTSEGRYGVG